MSTLEEFENAPIGATATDPDGRVAVKTFDGDIDPWMTRDYKWLSDKEMAENGYKLDTLVPTSAREALDLAWNLAHPIKKGQVVPAGTDYLRKNEEGKPSTMRWGIGSIASARDEEVARTLDPLPDPLPDWLDAPAVIAACTYCEFEGGDGPQVTIHGPFFDGQRWECTECHTATDWTNLRDVTPLYPKEG